MKMASSRLSFETESNALRGLRVEYRKRMLLIMRNDMITEAVRKERMKELTHEYAKERAKLTRKFNTP